MAFSRSHLVWTLILVWIVTTCAAPVPHVSRQGGYSTSPEPTQDVTFYVTFENRGTTFGFSPVIDVLLPEGLTFKSATVFGQSATTTQTTNGIHPLTGETITTPLTSDTLLVVELPYLSFAPDQPVTIAVITLTADDAPLNEALSVRARSLFWRGADPEVNPSADPPITDGSGTAAGTWAELGQVTITPPPDPPLPPPNVLATYINTFGNPVVQSTTTYTYTVDIRAPTNEVYTGMYILIPIPPELAYQGHSVSGGAATRVAQPPVVGTPLNQPESLLNISLGDWTASAAAVDRRISIDVTVPLRDANGDLVMDYSIGSSTTTTLSAQLFTTELVANSTVPPILITPTPRSASVSRGVSLRVDSGASKSVAISIDRGVSGFSPGDQLRYRLTWPDLSDYHTVGDIVVTDTLSDGQRVNTSLAPVLSISGGAGVEFTIHETYSINETLIQFDAEPESDGTTVVTFNVSGQAARQLNQTLLTGPLSYTIDFWVESQDVYSDSPRVNSFVRQGEGIENSATWRHEFYNVSSHLSQPLRLGSRSVSDRVTLSTSTGTLQAQTVYALNGTVCPSEECVSPQFQPGTNATLRILYTLPFSSIDGLQLTFFLPFPIMDLTNMTTAMDTTISAVPPPVFNLKFGPSETLFPLSGSTPDVNVSLASNRIDITVPRFNDVNNLPSTIDILMTVPVTTVTGFKDNSPLQIVSYTIEQGIDSQVGQVSSTQLLITLREPELTIASTAVHVSGANSDILPSVPSTLASILPKPFSCAATPPLATSDFTGDQVTGTNSSVVTRVDAGDLITFAIVLHNHGGAPAYDTEFFIDVPFGNEIVGTSPCAFNGRREAISLQHLGTDASRVQYRLADPSASVGALHPDSGRDVVVVVVNVRANNSLVAGVERDLVQGIQAYYGGPESPHNHITTPLTANSTLQTELPVFVKTIANSSLSQSGTSQGVAGLVDLSYGEMVTFAVTAVVPEGTVRNLSVHDNVPPHLSFSGFSVTLGSSISLDPGYPQFIAGHDSKQLSVLFGDVVNTYDNSLTTGDQVTVHLAFRNQPNAGNLDGTVSNNTASLQLYPIEVPFGPSVLHSYAVVETVAPALCVTAYTTSDANGDAADVVTLSATIAHCAHSHAAAYNVHWTDRFDDIFEYVASSVAVSGTVTGVTTSTVDGLHVQAPVMALGETLTVTYRGQVRQTAGPGVVHHHMSTLFGSSDHYEPSNVNYTIAANVTYTVDGPTVLDLTMQNTSLPETGSSKYTSVNPDMAIGEAGVLVARFRFAEGTYNDDVKLSIIVPTQATKRMHILGNETVTLGSSLTASKSQVRYTNIGGSAADDLVEVNLGRVENIADDLVNDGDIVTMRVHVQVFDLIDNENGAELTANANLTSGDIMPPSAELTIDLVEPQIFVFKNPNATVGDGGDVFLFSVEFRHDAQPPASTSSLYNFTFIDIPAETLRIDCSSFSIVSSDVPVTFDPSKCNDEQVINVHGDQLDDGQTVKVSYLARLNDTITPGSKVDNEAAVVGLSTPHGSGRYYSFNTSVQILTDTPETSYEILNHTVASTNFSEFRENQMDLSVGERIVIRITTRIPEGSMFIEEEISLPTNPGKLSLISAQVTSVGDNIVGAVLKAGDPPTATNDTNSDAIPDYALFQFAAISNIPDGIEDDKDLIVMDVLAELIDVPENTQGVQLELKTTTRFQLGNQPCYETTWNNGKKKQVMFPVVLPDKTAVEFYSYGTPRGSSANTGYEQLETTLMYFVIDKTNQTAFVLVHDLPNNADGGDVITTIQSDSLAGLDIQLMLTDDPGDSYSWDRDLGRGQFDHHWVECCTDGAVLGYFPPTEFCFRPTFQFLGGITQASLMVQDENGDIQYTYIPLDELNGLEVCGHTCSEATRTLSSKTSTFKFDVVEPELVVTKTANITTGDGLDSLLYTISVQHATSGPASHSAAFDLHIEDIPTFWDSVPTSIRLPANATLESPVSHGNDSIVVLLPTLLKGDTATISFEAIIKSSVRPFLSYTNLVNTTFDSHQNTRGRLHYVEASHTLSVATPTLIRYDVIDPLNTASNYHYHATDQVDMQIGSTAVLEIEYSLSEASQTITLHLDVNQPGVELLWSNITQVGANLISGGLTEGLAGSLSDTDSDGLHDRIDYAFGPIANLPDNVGDVRDRFTIKFALRVVSHPMNVDGVVFTVNSTLDYQDNSVLSVKNIDILEPVLAIAQTANTSLTDAGDAVKYTITVEHTTASSGPAHNVTIFDPLPPEVRLYPNTITCSPACDLTSDSGTQMEVFYKLLSIGTLVTITYETWYIDTVTFNTNVVTSPRVNYTSYFTDQSRAYHAQTSESVLIESPTQEFSISNTSLVETTGIQYRTPNVEDLSVGEIVTFYSKAILPEGSTPGLTFAFRFPVNSAGMEVRSASVVAIGAQIDTSQQIVSITNGNTRASFDFGFVTNRFDNSAPGPSNELLVSVSAIVTDVPGNTAGTQVRARSTLASTGPTRTRNIDLDLVQSELSITKTVNTTSGDAGDVIFYTVTLDHTAGSTGPAYNLTISDEISGFMALQQSLVTSSHGVVQTTASSLTVSLDVLPLGDGPVVITIPVVVQASVTPDQVVENRATARWNTADVEGRPLEIEASNTELQVRTVSIFDLTVLNTSLPETLSAQHNNSREDVAVGEVIALELSTLLPEGTSNLTFRAEFGRGTGEVVFLSSAMHVIGSRITFLETPITHNSPVGGMIDATRYHGYVGRVLNAPDNVLSSGDELKLLLYLRVKDVPVNTDGVSIVCRGHLDFDQGSLHRTLGMDIVEPQPQISLVADTASGDAGDVVQYTVTVRNLGAATGPMYNTVVETVNVPHMTTEPSLLSMSTTGYQLLANTTSGYNLTIDQIAIGGSVTLTYLATISDTAGYATPVLTHEVRGTAQGNDKNPARHYPMSTSTDLSVVSTSSLIDLTVRNSSVPETTAGTHVELAIGERVTLRSRVRLPEGRSRLTYLVTWPAGGPTRDEMVYHSVSALATSTISLIAPAATTSSTTDADTFHDNSTIVYPEVLNIGDNLSNNNDILTVDFTGIVGNDAGSVDGTQLTVGLRFEDTHSASTATAVVAVVEPHLTLNLAVNNTRAIADYHRSLHADLPNGSPVQISATITAPSGLSSSAAFNTELVQNFLGKDMKLLRGSVTTSQGSVTSGNGGTDTEVRVAVGRLLPTESATVQFTVFPSPSAPLGSQMVTNATLSWTSIPTASIHRRDYSTGAGTEVTLLLAGPNITALVANDPDDGDHMVYSNGDTISIVFGQPTNTPPIATRAQVMSEFSFTQNLGNDFTGTWVNNSAALITIVDSGASSPPTIGTLTVSCIGTLTNLAGSSSTSRHTSTPISGDWGRQGPQIASIVADDPDNLDAVYSDLDTVTIFFSEATNEPPVATDSDVRTLFTLGTLASNVTGFWVTPQMLRMSIVEASTAPPAPVIGGYTLSVQGDLRDDTGFTLPSRAVSPVLTGDWGLAEGPAVQGFVANDPDDMDTVFSDGDTLDILFDMKTNEHFLRDKSEVDTYFQFSSSLGTNYTGEWLSDAVVATNFAANVKGVTRITVHNVTGHANPRIGDLRVTLKRTSPFSGITNNLVTTFASVDVSDPITGDWGLDLAPKLVAFVANDPDDLDVIFSRGDTVTVLFDIDTNQPAITTASQMNSVFTLSQGFVNATGVWTSPREAVITILGPEGGDPGIAALTLTAEGSKIQNAYLNSSNTQSSSLSLSGDWGKRRGPYILQAIADDADNLDSVYSVNDTITIYFSEATDQSGTLSSSQVNNLLAINEAMGNSLSGRWYNASVLEITVIDPLGAAPPAIGTLVVSIRNERIRDASATSGWTSEIEVAQAKVTGDWGLKVGPRILSVVASDADNLDAVFSVGDSIAITFSEPTSRPALNTTSDVDRAFAFSLSIGQNYSGTWTSPSQAVLTILDARANDGRSTPLPFWNIDGSARPGLLTVAVRPGVMTNALYTTVATTSPSPPVTGNWGTLRGPVLSTVAMDDPDDLDAVFGVDDIIVLTFAESTNQPNLTTPSLLGKCVTFWDNTTAQTVSGAANARRQIVRIAQTQVTSGLKQLSLGSEVTGQWLSDTTLRMTIVNATGADKIPANPSDFIVQVQGYIQAASGLSLPAQTSSADTAGGVSGGDWGLLPGPSIISVLADDPDDADNVYSNGDTLLIEFDQPVGYQPDLRTKINVDLVVSFSQSLGANYTGEWLSTSNFLLTIVDITGNESPSINVLTVTAKPGANMTNAQGISLPSSGTSPAIGGDWGIAIGLITGGGDGRTLGEGECKTFWCRWWWVLVLAILSSIIGCALLAYWRRQLVSHLKQLQAQREAMAARWKQERAQKEAAEREEKERELEEAEQLELKKREINAAPKLKKKAALPAMKVATLSSRPAQPKLPASVPPSISPPPAPTQQASDLSSSQRNKTLVPTMKKTKALPAMKRAVMPMPGGSASPTTIGGVTTLPAPPPIASLPALPSMPPPLPGASPGRPVAMLPPPPAPTQNSVPSKGLVPPPPLLKRAEKSNPTLPGLLSSRRRRPTLTDPESASRWQNLRESMATHEEALAPPGLNASGRSASAILVPPPPSNLNTSLSSLASTKGAVGVPPPGPSPGMQRLLRRQRSSSSSILFSSTGREDHSSNAEVAAPLGAPPLLHSRIKKSPLARTRGATTAVFPVARSGSSAALPVAPVPRPPCAVRRTSSARPTTAMRADAESRMSDFEDFTNQGIPTGPFGITSENSLPRVDSVVSSGGRSDSEKRRRRRRMTRQESVISSARGDTEALLGAAAIEDHE